MMINVLVVEDNTSLRRAMRAGLEATGQVRARLLAQAESRLGVAREAPVLQVRASCFLDPESGPVARPSAAARREVGLSRDTDSEFMPLQTDVREADDRIRAHG